MAHYKTMFDEKEFLYAYDLDGREVTVTIESVAPGEIVGAKGRRSRKPFLRFVGKKKRFAVNRTNGATIATLYGTDATKWVGKSITLFPTMTDMEGKSVECIRVRPQVPRGKANTAPDAPPPPVTERMLDPDAAPLTADEQAEIAAAEREAGR